MPWIWIALIVGGLAAGYGLVWWAGGTKTAMPHFLYFPIVFAAMVGGPGAGSLAALAAGLLVGPLMPLDTTLGLPQTTVGWLVRIGFFVGVGLVVGEGRRRLLSMEATRQRFVSAIAHEVRTPLAAILGFSRVLSDDLDDLDGDEIREFGDSIHRQVTELHDVIEGYIIAGRLTDASLVFEPQVTDLDEVVRQTVGDAPSSVRSNRLDLDLQPAVCWADPTRVRQAVRAVLGHCLAYAEGTLTVATTSRQGQASLMIRHSDPSHPSELREALNPLSDLDTEASRPYPVGMGLAVAARLVDLMDGTLTHHHGSRGATIELRLPPVPRGAAATRHSPSRRARAV